MDILIKVDLLKLYAFLTYQVFLTGKFEGTQLDGLMSLVDDGFDCGLTEPRGRVAEGKFPDARYNICCLFDSTDALRFHRVTDCNVALNRERGQAQRRSINTSLKQEIK